RGGCAAARGKRASLEAISRPPGRGSDRGPGWEERVGTRRAGGFLRIDRMWDVGGAPSRCACGLIFPGGPRRRAFPGWSGPPREGEPVDGSVDEPVVQPWMAVDNYIRATTTPSGRPERRHPYVVLRSRRSCAGFRRFLREKRYGDHCLHQAF